MRNDHGHGKTKAITLMHLVVNTYALAKHDHSEKIMSPSCFDNAEIEDMGDMCIIPT